MRTSVAGGETERLLTYGEVAGRLGVWPRTVQRWVRERRVPHVRLPTRGRWSGVRFVWTEIESWLRRHSVRAVHSVHR